MRKTVANCIFIGVVGTHSTGKTTFLAALRASLEHSGHRVALVNDLAAKAKQLGFGILREHTVDSTLWIMARGIADEIVAGLTADIVLVDRAVPDALAYLDAALRLRGERLSPADEDYLYTLARLHATRYTLLFQSIPHSTLPIEDDGRRDCDEGFRRLIMSCLDETLRRLEVHALPLEHDGWAAAIAQCTVAVRQASFSVSS